MLRMDGEGRAWRRTAAIAGLMAFCALGAAQADAPGSVRFQAQGSLSGSAPIYDAATGGFASAPIYSPGDRQPAAPVYGTSPAPLGSGPVYDPYGSSLTTGSSGFVSGPVYNPAPAAYAPTTYAPTYAPAPVAYAPPPPPSAKENDVFGYAPSAACGGLLEGERCLVILGDHTRRVRLDRDATTILVGNPAVADVTVLSKRTMFVSARSVGSTNIVALDENENEIASWEVFVREPEAKRVTLRQGPTRENYQCAPYCERSLSQNDSPSAHSSHLSVISAEMGLDRGAVGAQGGGVPPEAAAAPAPATGSTQAPAAPAAPAASAAQLEALQQLMSLGGAGGARGAGANPGQGLQTDPAAGLPPPDYMLN